MPRPKGSLNKKTLEKLNQTNPVQNNVVQSNKELQKPLDNENLKKGVPSNEDPTQKIKPINNAKSKKSFGIVPYQGKRPVLRSVKLNVDGLLDNENPDNNDPDELSTNSWKLKVLDKEYNTTEKVKSPECFIVVLIAPDNTIPKILSLHEYEEGKLYTSWMFKDKSASNPQGMTKNDLCNLVDFEKEVKLYNKRNKRIDNQSVDNQDKQSDTTSLQTSKDLIEADQIQVE